MKKAQLTVVRFDAEDVIATSYFAVPNGGNYNIYTGFRGIYVDGKGYFVKGGEYYDTYDSESFDSTISNNLLYNPMYAAFFDNEQLYATQYKYNTNSAHVEGQGASGFPTNPPAFPIP